MEFFVSMFLGIMNTGLMVGLISLAYILLRPIFTRVFTAGQRLWIWMLAWIFGYIPMRGFSSILPLTFQDLVIPRTGGFYSRAPAILPESYEGPGAYNVALPGGALVEVELTDLLLNGAMLVWLLGMGALLVLFWRRDRALRAVSRRGRKMELTDPLLAPHAWMRKKTSPEVHVWIARDLPTSYVRSVREYDVDYEICLQAELPPEQMELVLRHEMSHLSMNHIWWKGLATVNVVLFWWNPLVWLGFRYFCRDMELACDARVMRELDPGKRKQYAELLLELGRGRPLLEMPLAFGECDAALRVRAVADWKPRSMAFAVLTWALTVCVILFFYGGQRTTQPARDLELAFEREYGSVEPLRRQLNEEMAKEWELADNATPEHLIPDLGIVQVWEGPDKALKIRQLAPGQMDFGDFEKMKEIANGGGKYETVTKIYATLFVHTADGSWYQVYHSWNGAGTTYLGLERIEECALPDLTKAHQLLG